MSNPTNSTAPDAVPTERQERRSDRTVDAATEVANRAVHLNGRLMSLLDRLDPQPAEPAGQADDEPKSSGFFPTIEDEHTRARLFLESCHGHMENIENLI